MICTTQPWYRLLRASSKDLLLEDAFPALASIYSYMLDRCYGLPIIIISSAEHLRDIKEDLMLFKSNGSPTAISIEMFLSKRSLQIELGAKISLEDIIAYGYRAGRDKGGFAINGEELHINLSNGSSVDIIFSEYITSLKVDGRDALLVELPRVASNSHIIILYDPSAIEGFINNREEYQYLLTILNTAHSRLFMINGYVDDISSYIIRDGDRVDFHIMGEKVAAQNLLNTFQRLPFISRDDLKSIKGEVIVLSDTLIKDDRSMIGAISSGLSFLDSSLTIAVVRDKIYNLSPMIGKAVVDERYGIGILKGIVKRDQDLMEIAYDGGSLFLPLHKAYRIYPYLGKSFKLDKLGSPSWNKQKSIVKKGIISFAKDLAKLQVKRDTISGIALGKVPEEVSFAKEFPYDESPDQEKAIEDTLNDIGSTKIMDRLICGEVGYGKTEVAIRAAFRVAMHGKQVALLSPTTILAKQHYENFLNRFSNYDINIDLHSSDRSLRDKRLIKEMIADGSIDIIIGTHGILRLPFKDLSFLIIDEEQRFGVRDKEILKSKRVSLDTLSLTATPIPRSLYLTMISMRDISLIESPPIGRGVVETYIEVGSRDLIKRAILEEVSRGGQAFYIYDRVEVLPDIFKELTRIFPQLSIAMAHGAMSKKILSKVMERFRAGDIDILLSTSIVESGIDIPNVNLIIVDGAHLLGLSDLHQLRGRVGRGSRDGKCLFLIDESVGRESIERIKLLGRCRGSKLSYRELDRRGWGDVLGERQSGYASRVGLYLYSKMLKEEIRKIKGDYKEIHWEMELDLHLDDYIKNDDEKINLYREIGEIDNMRELLLLKRSLQRQWGSFSSDMDLLYNIHRLRIEATNMGCDGIVIKTRDIVLYRGKRSWSLQWNGKSLDMTIL